MERYEIKKTFDKIEPDANQYRKMLNGIIAFSESNSKSRRVNQYNPFARQLFMMASVIALVIGIAVVAANMLGATTELISSGSESQAFTLAESDDFTGLTPSAENFYVVDETPFELDIELVKVRVEKRGDENVLFAMFSFAPTGGFVFNENHTYGFWNDNEINFDESKPIDENNSWGLFFPVFPEDAGALYDWGSREGLSAEQFIKDGVLYHEFSVFSSGTQIFELDYIFQFTRLQEYKNNGDRIEWISDSAMTGYYNFKFSADEFFAEHIAFKFNEIVPIYGFYDKYIPDEPQNISYRFDITGQTSAIGEWIKNLELEAIEEEPDYSKGGAGTSERETWTFTAETNTWQTFFSFTNFEGGGYFRYYDGEVIWHFKVQNPSNPPVDDSNDREIIKG